MTSRRPRPADGGDASGLSRLGRDVQQQLRLLGAALDSAANAVFITDAEGRIKYLNQRSRR